jgi:hypothetical protein
MRQQMDHSIVGRTATDERLVDYGGDDLDPIHGYRAGGTQCLVGLVSIPEVAYAGAVNEREELGVAASAGIEDLNGVCLPLDDAFDHLAIARVGQSEWRTKIIVARLYHRCTVCGQGGLSNEG